MEIGLDSFVAATLDGKTGQAIEPARNLRELLEAIKLADEVGLDICMHVAETLKANLERKMPDIPNSLNTGAAMRNCDVCASSNVMQSV